MAGLPPPPKPVRAREDQGWVWIVAGVVVAAVAIGLLSFAWLRRSGQSSVFVSPAAQTNPYGFRPDVLVTPNSVKGESGSGFAGKRFICSVTIRNNSKSQIGLAPELVGAAPDSGPAVFGSITSYVQNTDPKNTYLKPPSGYLAPGESITADLVLFGASDTKFVRWGYRSTP